MKTAEATALSNYQCLKVAFEDTVVITTNSEMVATAKVLDKCNIWKV